jgi:heme-degrading monooxygenase HmoA
MHAVIFEVHPTRAGYDSYLATAAALRPLLDEIDGFLTIERFGSLSRPEWILSLSHWVDEAALTRWRAHEKHYAAQQRGRQSVFEDYRLRVGQVFPDDDFVEIATSPTRRTAYNDHTRRKIGYVGILEVDAQTPELVKQRLERNIMPHVPQASGGDSYHSLMNPGKVAHLVAFEDEASIGRWRDQIKLALGGERDPATMVRLRLIEVERDYGLFNRAQAPQYFPNAIRPE